MRSLTIGLAAAGLLLSVPAAAQSQKCYYVPDSSTSGGENTAPFDTTSESARPNCLYQMVVTRSDLGGNNAVAHDICELGFVPTLSRTQDLGNLTIRMNHTTLTPTTLSTTFGANLGTNPVVVLNENWYTFETVISTWMQIGLQNRFSYDPNHAKGPNIIIEIETHGLRTANTGYRNHTVAGKAGHIYMHYAAIRPTTGYRSTNQSLRIQVCNDIAYTLPYGVGCQGSTGKTPKLSFSGSSQGGQTLGMHLTNALPSTSVVFVAGTNNGPLYPMNLTFYGAPGCYLYPRPDVQLGWVADDLGRATIPYFIPYNVPCAKFYIQWFCVDPRANPAGATASNAGILCIGT